MWIGSMRSLFDDFVRRLGVERARAEWLERAHMPPMLVRQPAVRGD